MADEAGTVDFDPTTAKPVADDFDPASAKPAAVPDEPKVGAVTGKPLKSPTPRVTREPSTREMIYGDTDFSGLPFMDRVHLKMADNLKEKEAYLKNRYGKNSVALEPGPSGKKELFVTINGKKYAAEGGGSFAPSLVADSPEMIGMTGGAMAGGAYGSAAGPLGTAAGAVVGAGIGGMFGKTAEEGTKSLEGFYDKTPGEYAHGIGEAGLGGMAGEVAGRGVSKVLSRATRGPLPSLLTDTTPESRAMTERVLAGGARPPASSTMPGARKIQRIETLANKISGPPRKQEAANRKYLEDRVKSVLVKAGIPAEHADTVLRELDTPTAALSTQKVGTEVQAAVRAHQQMLEQGVEDSLKAARASTDESLSHLNKLAERYKPGDLGLDVAGGIAQARVDFATASGKVYKQVDRLTGGRAVYPTKQAAAEAQKLMALIPESDAASRAVVKGIADYPPFVTFEQAQRARTQLHDLMYSANLTPGATKHEYGKLADALDRGFDMAKKITAEDFTPPTTAVSAEDAALLGDFGISTAKPAPKNAPELAASARAAARTLEQADRFYSEGVKKFNDATINRLVQATRAGLPPDPSVIAKTIIQPGQEARVAEIRKLVGEDTFKRVMAQDWQNIVTSVSGQDGAVSGRKLFQEVTRRGKLLDAVYGKDEAARIRTLAESLSAIDGHIPVEKMQQGATRDLVEQLQASQKRLDDFMKQNFMSTLADPKKTPEDAYLWITKPGQTERLEEVEKFFGKDSPQMQGIREAATRTLLNGVVTRAVKDEGSRALTNAMKEYTEKQQKILFPNGLDEDIRLLGREVEFLFPGDADPAMSGMTAGAIMERALPRRLYAQAKYGVLRMMLQNPHAIRALALGLRGTGPVRESTRQTIRELAYFGAIEFNDDDDGGTDDEQHPAGPAAGGTG